MNPSPHAPRRVAAVTAVLAMARASIPIAAVAAALPATLTGCVAKGPQRFHLVPLPSPTLVLDSGGATVRTPTLRFSITPLDDLARAAFIHSKAPAATDPFGPDMKGNQRFLSFRLLVENLGANDAITFQALSIILAQQSGERIYPIDFPEAYRRLAGGPDSDPRLLSDLAKYMFDVGVNLPPGERIERLLVYPSSRFLAKKLRMEFDFLESATKNTHFDVFFRKETAS